MFEIVNLRNVFFKQISSTDSRLYLHALLSIFFYLSLKPRLARPFVLSKGRKTVSLYPFATVASASSCYWQMAKATLPCA
ncbi:hypothetical protein C4F40_01670 [Sphingobacterium sp. Ka21]|uniref:Uncharacterized protein n=1 Tax=Sphingobacterium pedocola TaxID=2082722 RepID=A0ABR9T267_9SPHI|nr:hypothetical protein [Sphingobacterium pedocola]